MAGLKTEQVEETALPDLPENYPAYHFFLLCLWLESHLGEVFFEKNVAIKHSGSLSFTASDISFCHEKKSQSLTFSVNFMGLLGVNSPLPSYFNELALVQVDNTAIKKFLEIIDNRIYQLYYHSWRHYRLGNPSQIHPRLNNYLSAISGLRLKDELSHYQHYASVFSWKERGVATLSWILKQILATDAVEIKVLDRFFAVKKIAGLGNGLILAGNALLGNEICRANARLLVVVDNFSWENFQQKILNQQSFLALKKFLGDYLGTVQFHFYLTIKTCNKVMSLGEKTSLLGYHTWLGEAEHISIDVF